LGQVLRFRRGRAWRPRASFVSALVIATLLGAGIGSMWFDRRPTAVSGSGVFRLCGSAASQNCVVDGDTTFYRGVKIRLADIDAPETVGAQCALERALGERAKQRLLVLINQGPFELVRTGRDEDIYGRKLRVIQRGGRSLGDVLVAEGLARPWDGARQGWCGSASAALSPVASALERFPIGRNELLALIAGVLVAVAALFAVPVWRWRIRKSTIERDFKNVFAFTSREGKEALIKSWVDRKKCSRLEAMRLAVEEWRHDANRW
jgi:endonuclease YncB( thermonuclease family)